MATYRKIKEIVNGDVKVVVGYSSEWKEYRVRLVGHDAADYFTDDKQDAIDTAGVIARVASKI